MPTILSKHDTVENTKKSQPASPPGKEGHPTHEDRNFGKRSPRAWTMKSLSLGILLSEAPNLRTLSVNIYNIYFSIINTN